MIVAFLLFYVAVSCFTSLSCNCFVLNHRSSCRLAPIEASMIELEVGNFQKEVIESTEPVLVDFMANWCGPCKLTAPIFKALAEEFDNVKFVKVDTGKVYYSKYFMNT